MINGERPKWQAKSLCAVSPNVCLDDFYKTGSALPLVKLRRVCASCPVNSECREWADEMSPSWGFFAGETVEERTWRRRNPGQRKAKI